MEGMYQYELLAAMAIKAVDQPTPARLNESIE